jgi:hypothetical protein
MADLTNNAFVLSFALHLRKLHMKQMICSKQLLVNMIREEDRLLNGFFPECSENLVVDCEHADCSTGCRNKNVKKVHKIDGDQ